MKTTNHKLLRSGFILVFLFFLQAGLMPSPLEIAIDVAPNVLNIQNQGEVVTVHTDIAYNLVAGATVTLNGLEISWWKSDDRGNFVAKFDMEQVKGLVDQGLLDIGEITLTLWGESLLGEFTGVQTIKVISIIPKGK